MIKAPFAVVATIAFFGFGASYALAQAARVFVSGSGSDANPCSLAEPCRSFQQAHNTVAAGGEVVALDAAGYGPLTISKAVTITAIGIEASITTNNTNNFSGIRINTGASDVVTIRGLTLIAGANSVDGIDIGTANSVTILDCSISGFMGDGILVDTSANLDVELHGVSVRNSGLDGLEVFPSGSGKLTMLVADSTFSRSGTTGVKVDGSNSSGTLNVTLNVNAAGNSSRGIEVFTIPTKTQPAVMITGSKLVNNGIGLLVNGSGQVFVDHTQISGNGGDGWEAINGAAVSSYKNNAVNGNGTDGLNGVVQISSE